ncbi:hypothetical protein DFJ43DRAFT_1151783 [Lentinula guzmanii]|uniref:Uncharacterized protein n=1 Tax=Lentinula guzmanii TaxID=2804957 RepID=A0AA38N223_9AGAR|nr:hypothetical protein DFJ43DRAFT_1151783 [Lentinula guzmanii]
MDPMLTDDSNRLMPTVATGLVQKSSSSINQERSEHARRRNIPVPPLPQVESIRDPSTASSQITSSQIDSSASESIPVSPSSSVSSTLSDMSRNISGSGWVDMGTSKAGCQLLIANPTLDALEELWSYVITNLEDREISDETTKKKEFLRCFAKWGKLKDTIAEISGTLSSKAWIEVDEALVDPEDFVSRPFFDTIRDKILGNDWACVYDLKCEKYVTLPNMTGFSELVTLMETHNRRLHGTMYHQSNEVLQALIMQKLPDKFRADLRDCKVSENLPYGEWKMACKDVEERRPPVLPSASSIPKRPDFHLKRLSSAVPYGNNLMAGVPVSMTFQSNARSNRFPKLHPEQKKILYKLEVCFHCYNLFAGHLSNNCPANGPPSLSVPFRPLNKNDIMLATLPGSSTSGRAVAAVSERVALTELPDLDDVHAPIPFVVQPSDVAAFYGSNNIVYSVSGADMYGSSLSRGLSDYNPAASRPVRKPIAALIPSRRSEREYYDEHDDNGSIRFSPSYGRRTRRHSHSRSASVSSSEGKTGSPAGSVNEMVHDTVSVKEKAPCSGLEGGSTSTMGQRARSAPSVSESDLVDSPPMPFVMPHLEWEAKIIGPLGFSVQKPEACPLTAPSRNVFSYVVW